MSNSSLGQIATRLLQKSYTPAVKEMGPLIDLLTDLDENVVSLVTKAAQHHPEAGISHILQGFSQSQRPQRARMLSLLVRLAILQENSCRQLPQILTLLISCLGDKDFKTKLTAIQSFGTLSAQLSHDQRTLVEDALLSAWTGLKRPLRPEVWRSFVRTFGQIGGAKLDKILFNDDGIAADKSMQASDLLLDQKVLSQARTIRQRDGLRAQTGKFADDQPLAPGAPGGLWLLTVREGLEEIARDEMVDRFGKDVAQMVTTGVGCLSVPFDVIIEKCGIKRLVEWQDLGQLRCVDKGVLWYPLETKPRGKALKSPKSPKSTQFPTTTQIDRHELLLKKLQQPAIKKQLSRLTVGPLRYRLDDPDLSNAQVWSVVERLSKAWPAWSNDPRSSLWEFSFVTHSQVLGVALAPKGWEDRRFEYRMDQVPASSHAPLAAALARVAGVRNDDHVWDPFCGAGTELIERALLGPCSSLLGTDLASAAVDATRANMLRAGVNVGQAMLHDASSELASGNHDLTPPTLTITNPPLGRRLLRSSIKDFFLQMTPIIGRRVPAKGRLVWVSPFPDMTAQLLKEQGLTLTYRKLVDLGGFTAEIQRADRLHHG